jgi:hypothetical protein
MDTGTLTFVAILLLAIIIPVTIINRKNKKKERQFLQSLSDFAAKSNCRISEHQLWNDILIGEDRDARQMFFIRKTEDIEFSRQVKLSEMQKCRVVNTSRSVSSKEGNYFVAERIELTFTPRAGNEPDTVFEIYNSKFDSLTLQGELQLAEKWAAIANSMITNGRNG